MAVDRMKRINELLKREISGSLFKFLAESSIDISAITVLEVITSRNLRHARVMVSIRDHHDERDRMLSILRGQRKHIQEQINKNLVLKFTPRLSFEIDGSIEKGDHVLGILSQMEDVVAEDVGEDVGREMENGE